MSRSLCVQHQASAEGDLLGHVPSMLHLSALSGYFQFPKVAGCNAFAIAVSLPKDNKNAPLTWAFSKINVQMMIQSVHAWVGSYDCTVANWQTAAWSAWMWVELGPNRVEST